MTRKPPPGPKLWTERSIEDTRAVYGSWAKTYDGDIGAWGYQTPDRVADALVAFLPEKAAKVLDFGCGTGLSGAALRARGITRIDGTDISPEMLEIAHKKGIYDRLWQGQPGHAPATPGRYVAIVAAGVVSLGAAPPETLDALLDSLAPDGLLALSFNDPTLENGRYDARLDAHVTAGTTRILFREHGVHLLDPAMGSDVIVLQRL